MAATAKNTMKNTSTNSFGISGMSPAFRKRILKTVPEKELAMSGQICAKAILWRSVSRTIATTLKSDQSSDHAHCRRVGPDCGGHSHTSGTMSPKSGKVIHSTGENGAFSVSNHSTYTHGSVTLQRSRMSERPRSASTGAVSHDFFEVNRFISSYPFPVCCCSSCSSGSNRRDDGE